jgi:hypothetical protein
MMVNSSLLFFTLSLVASALSISLTHSKYDNITVNDDVQNLLTKLTTSQQDVGNAINGFASPGGTLTQALVGIPMQSWLYGMGINNILFAEYPHRCGDRGYYH